MGDKVIVKEGHFWEEVGEWVNINLGKNGKQKMHNFGLFA